MPFYPGMDVGKLTKKQMKREQRRKDKEARREARKRCEWERLRHKARQKDPYRSPDNIAAAKALRRQKNLATIASAVALVSLDEIMRPKENF